MIPDVASAAALFRWTRGETLDMGPMGPCQRFDIDAEPRAAIMTRESEAAPPSWCCCFRVDSMGATRGVWCSR